MIIKNDKGEDIEVFTNEDLAQRVQTETEAARAKAVEEYKAANPDKSKELEDLQKKIADAEADLKAATESGGGRPEQVERLRKDRDEARKAAAEAAAEVDKKLSEYKNETVRETREEALDRFSKGDVSLRKKLEVEFDNYKPGLNSKKEIEERMSVAYRLVTNNMPAPSIMNNMGDASARGVGGNFGVPPGDGFTDNEKQLGSKFGITDDERANYNKSKKK